MRKLTYTILLLALTAGCADNSKQLTPKEQAIQNWNDARAGVMLNLARDQYNSGDFDKARQTINQAIQMDPASTGVHILSARIAIEQGQLEQADQELNSARAINPKLPEADYLSGVIYQRWQQPAKALIFYHHARTEAPTELAYLVAEAETLVSLNRQSEALALLQEKADFFEHSPVIHDEMGMIFLQQNKPDDAVAMFRWANILAPDDVTIREHLALGLFQDKRFGEAVMNLQRLLKNQTLAKRDDLFLTLAECQLELNQFVEARVNATTACDLNPAAAANWLTLAKASLKLGDQRRAETGVTRALAADPDSSQGYLLLGYVRLKQNQLPAALAAFRRASSLDAGDTTSLCMSGYVLEKMSRPREAAAYYQQALKLDPSDAMAHQLLAGIGGE
jgi:tetratricopeptide (TPR) repeat protein